MGRNHEEETMNGPSFLYYSRYQNTFGAVNFAINEYGYLYSLLSVLRTSLSL
jgi:hypothetical protein